MPHKPSSARKFTPLFMILNGLVCLLFSEQILGLLPTICGSFLLVRGAVLLTSSIRNKDYLEPEESDLASAIVSLAMGVGLLYHQENALFTIAVFWGAYGLIKASRLFNEALKKIAERRHFLRPLLESLVGFGISFLLIFDPDENIAHHILILGAELIYEALLELAQNFTIHLTRGKRELM